MFERFFIKKESEPRNKIEIERGFEDFIPEDFKKDPLGYFELWGKNIKAGEIKKDEAGMVREDPTAVKNFPAWINKEEILMTIGKKVNVKKGKIGESKNPFYEYEIIKALNEVGLPSPRLIAKAENNGNYLFVMEKVPGINWYEKDFLDQMGLNKEDKENILKEAEMKMEELKNKFEKAGVERGWKLKDMVFDIDFESKTIRKITPVDFERTKINKEKLASYKQELDKNKEGLK